MVSTLWWSAPLKRKTLGQWCFLYFLLSVLHLARCHEGIFLYSGRWFYQAYRADDSAIIHPAPFSGRPFVLWSWSVLFFFSLLLSFWWLSFVFTAWGWCVSHALRAPLTRCCGFTETALKCKCHNLTFKLLQCIKRNIYFFCGGGLVTPWTKV